MQDDLFITPRPASDLQDGNKPELSQWFTPGWAAEMLVADALEGMGDTGIIEPSCGDGAFLAAIPPNHHAIGVEIDPVMAERARRNSGREVILGDFTQAEIAIDNLGLIIGNPPFPMPLVDAFVLRSHELLPEDGLLAMILPAHTLSTAPRVARWNTMFGIEQKIIPRSLFPRISLPLVWTRFRKSQKRTLVGFLLFDEQRDIESMPREIRRALGRSGTWREAVGLALHALGGEAELSQIYQAVEPRRPSQNQWWRDKVRQTLGLYCERTGEHRAAIPTPA